VSKHEEEELGLGDTPGSLLADDREAGRRIKQLNDSSYQDVLRLPPSWSCKSVTIITAIYLT
jgi:hypothetical protein